MFADEQGSILSIWRKALAITGRYPLASIFPAAVLGILGGAPYYFIKEEAINLPEELVASLTWAFAFYFYIIYIAYAEQVTTEAEQGVERITMLVRYISCGKRLLWCRPRWSPRLLRS